MDEGAGAYASAPSSTSGEDASDGKRERHVESPLRPPGASADKFGVAADWYTGKHAAGYFTPGINFKPHPKVTGYVGYSIGNTGASNGNHFVYTAIGINFN